jgi:hypothetical protein
MMMAKIPGFVIFRSAYYKFIPALYFSYAILVGISVYYLHAKIKGKFRKISALLLFVFILIYHYPYFQKDNFIFNKPFSTMVKVPDYVYTFSNFAKSLPSGYRILVLPPLSENFPINIYKWNFFGFYTIFPGISDKSFIYNHTFSSPGEKALVKQIYNSLRSKDYVAFNTYANKLKIGYILITNDIESNYYPTAPTEDPKLYHDLVSGNNEFESIWQQGSWELYELDRKYLSKKIEAIDTISLYSGNYDDIDGAINSLNSAFVIDDGKNKLIGNREISYNFHITDYTCITCFDYSEREKIKSKQTIILPGSLLYPLKRFRDILSLRPSMSDEVKTERLLQLSLTRTAELERLENLKIESINKYEWRDVAETLAGYWSEIGRIMNDNFINIKKNEEIVRINDFVKLEDGVLNSIYNKLFLSANDPLKVSIANALWKMQLVIKSSDDFINAFNNRTKFTYNINSGYKQGKTLYLYNPSLPKDSNNSNYLMPLITSNYKNNSKLTYINKDNNTVIDTPQKVTKVTLAFSRISNELGGTNDEVISFPENKERCISAVINNFQWNKRYKLNVKIPSILEYVNIYLKRYHKILPVQQAPIVQNDYFYYDDKIDLKSLGNGVYESYFGGTQNDTGARVYFCTNSTNNPNTTFFDPEVSMVFTPKLYSIEKLSNIKYEKPLINYDRINSTKYNVTVKNAKKPFILLFGESYSPNWKLYENGKPIFEDKHFVINGYANAWLVDANGNHSLTIEFFPQKVFYIGIIVSTSSLLVLSLYILLKNIINYEKK